MLPASTRRLEHGEQPPDVVEVEAGRRLVEDVEGPPCRPPGQLPRELDALGLAAGERRRRLPETDVVETDLAQRLQPLPDGRNVPEESSASPTVRSRTSAMLSPLKRTSSVSRL